MSHYADRLEPAIKKYFQKEFKSLELGAAKVIINRGMKNPDSDYESSETGIRIELDNAFPHTITLSFIQEMKLLDLMYMSGSVDDKMFAMRFENILERYHRLAAKELGIEREQMPYLELSGVDIP